MTCNYLDCLLSSIVIFFFFFTQEFFWRWFLKYSTFCFYFALVLLLICYWFVIIPLRAKQVSEANLRSEQGGINFTPFVLSLPYAKKKKKKKKKLKFPIWMGVSSKMSVCLLSKHVHIDHIEIRYDNIKIKILLSTFEMIE